MSHYGVFVPRETVLDTHRVGGWIGRRAGLGSLGRGEIPLPLLGIEPRFLGSPPVAYVLYGLCYPDS